MKEEEFDSLMPGRPFRREDLTQAEADAGRFTTLGLAYGAELPLTPTVNWMLLILKYRRSRADVFHLSEANLHRHGRARCVTMQAITP